MKALVYHGPGRRSWEDKPRPAIREATDALVRITTATICGTDLHIPEGRRADRQRRAHPRPRGHRRRRGDGRRRGGLRARRPRPDLVHHLLRQVRLLQEGDVLALPERRLELGHTIDGTQAEYVRIPHADTSLYRLPPGADEEALVMLSDIFPTGFECGVLERAGEARRHRRDRGGGPDRPRDAAHAQFYSPAEL
jgi:alcohol dehydrogenase